MKLHFEYKEKKRFYIFLTAVSFIFLSAFLTSAQDESSDSTPQNKETISDRDAKAEEDSLKARYNDFLYQYDKEQQQKQSQGQQTQPPPTYSEWKDTQTSEKVHAQEYNRSGEKTGTREGKVYNKETGK